MDFLGEDKGDEDEVDGQILLPFCDDVSRSSALRRRPAGAGVLSFHAGMEDALLLYVERVATAGDPESVLTAIDNFCYTRHWMMHVGDIKGRLVERALGASQELNKPDSDCCAVELGSYCGYSAVRIAKSLSVGSVLYSVEIEDKCRKWTGRLLRYAGLADRVIIVASIADAVEAMRAARKKITFLFIDHAKEKYVEDLVYFEESGLMCSPGCTVVADNILCFDSPLESYLAHVSDTGKYSDFQLHESVVEYSGTASGSDTAGFGLNGAKDGIAVSVLK